MSAVWAVQFPRDRAMAAAHLRLWPGVSVREDGDSVWLRGESLDDELDRNLRKIPGAVHFRVDADGKLIAPGERIPRGTLPDDAWQPLSTWLAPRPQPAALAGQTPDRIALRLTRADREQPATVLMTNIADWLSYATSAPMVRLRRLQFAAVRGGRVIVRGTPLPSIAGRRFFEMDGVAVPCGYAVWPPVDSGVLRDFLRVESGGLALLHEDGSCERIEAGKFVAATRGAVRATAEWFEGMHASGVQSDG